MCNMRMGSFYFRYLIFSGKSNLMDAISFVLGENTRHLRVRRLNVGVLLVTQIY